MHRNFKDFFQEEGMNDLEETARGGIKPERKRQRKNKTEREKGREREKRW